MFLSCSHVYWSYLTLVMLNKLRCHTHFLLSANQIIWSRLLIQIHTLNDRQCRSRSVVLQKPTDLDLHCMQRQDMSKFSRTRAIISTVNIYCNYFNSHIYYPGCWYKFTYWMTDSADPDPLFFSCSSEANWSGSTLYAKTGHVQVQQDQGYHIFCKYLL